MTEIEKCEEKSLKELRKISIDTFNETFREFNKEKDIDDYINRAFTEEKLRDEIFNKNSYFYLCRENGAVVGYLKLNVNNAMSEVMNDDYIEIERIYILRDCQKKGIGNLFMKKAIETALNNGKNKIWLGVWEHNENALKFYRKHGFEIVSSHSFYMGDDEQTDYIMTKNM